MRSRLHENIEEKRGEITFFDPIYVVIGLCPNYASQGQIFPKISKQNQKLVEKVEWNQTVEITTFLNSKILALRIRKPQVRIAPGVS